ncbi:MAG TPA: hypothetical protein GXZ20_05065 [Halanaerobiaceae bacterium]|jgi:hypothetical protein|nr:hypothetical protein [Bacillota bacterium]HHU92488.1 hypothetical protein [Halanaerobiaceae bacterium]HOA41524.1 hypothetical protein [Halanaerobiales bacterium]HPZ63598.1 hypothetical protein [Halanaerobiales bacterium]HQD04568.1 hypothetical protein [Halanaerobiales bacterium]
MKVKRIYENQGENKEVIYLLENGNKIIQRSAATVSKFNLNKWDEVNFVPASFQEVFRDLSAEEEEGLKAFLLREDPSIWKRIKKMFSRFAK